MIEQDDGLVSSWYWEIVECFDQPEAISSAQRPLLSASHTGNSNWEKPYSCLVNEYSLSEGSRGSWILLHIQATSTHYPILRSFIIVFAPLFPWRAQFRVAVPVAHPSQSYLHRTSCTSRDTFWDSRIGWQPKPVNSAAALLLLLAYWMALRLELVQLIWLGYQWLSLGRCSTCTPQTY